MHCIIVPLLGSAIGHCHCVTVTRLRNHNINKAVLHLLVSLPSAPLKPLCTHPSQPHLSNNSLLLHASAHPRSPIQLQSFRRIRAQRKHLVQRRWAPYAGRRHYYTSRKQRTPLPIPPTILFHTIVPSSATRTNVYDAGVLTVLLRNPLLFVRGRSTTPHSTETVSLRSSSLQHNPHSLLNLRKSHLTPPNAFPPPKHHHK